jgi:hypothetical protein
VTDSNLVDQPSAVPTRKVAYATTAGAIGALMAWAIQQFGGITLPPGIEGALVVLIAGGIGYATRDRPNQQLYVR